MQSMTETPEQQDVEPVEPEGTPPGHEREPGKRTGTENAPGQEKKADTK